MPDHFFHARNCLADIACAFIRNGEKRRRFGNQLSIGISRGNGLELSNGRLIILFIQFPLAQLQPALKGLLGFRRTEFLGCKAIGVCHFIGIAVGFLERNGPKIKIHCFGRRFRRAPLEFDGSFAESLLLEIDSAQLKTGFGKRNLSAIEPLEVDDCGIQITGFIVYLPDFKRQGLVGLFHIHALKKVDRFRIGFFVIINLPQFILRGYVSRIGFHNLLKGFFGVGGFFEGNTGATIFPGRLTGKFQIQGFFRGSGGVLRLVELVIHARHAECGLEVLRVQPCREHITGERFFNEPLAFVRATELGPRFRITTCRRDVSVGIGKRLRIIFRIDKLVELIIGKYGHDRDSHDNRQSLEGTLP